VRVSPVITHVAPVTMWVVPRERETRVA
jgi:hypothetical protein